MTAAEKERLLNTLAGSYTAIKNSIEGVDIEIVVYEDSNWQIRDILWHIAVWDRQVTKSMRAFMDGGEYAIPAFAEDTFNDDKFIEGHKLNTEQVLVEFEQARTAFKDSVRDLPEEKFALDLLYPWGDERGDIVQLVEYMVEHDEEHRAEISAALTT